MGNADIVFDKTRRLSIVAGDSWVADPDERFAALLPAWTPEDVLAAKMNLPRLIAAGSCLEICCVGPRSEELHDAVDELVEDADQLTVVTTWETDMIEGCEYFLHVSAGHPRLLVVLASSASELVETLVAMLGRESLHRTDLN